MKTSVAIIAITFVQSATVSAAAFKVPDWLYPWQCPMIKCLDPCAECPVDSCITEPTVYDYYGLQCSGCPKLVSCGPKDDTLLLCCHPKLEPTDVECGRSGCTCCGGKWITGNSGPTLPDEDVCKQLELPLTKVCEANDTLCCDPELEPKDFDCGLSGCTCCGGKWFTGNSGPTLPAEEVCKQLELPLTKVCSSPDTDTLVIEGPVGGQQCGKIRCAVGQSCCNASCSTCTNKGDACTQQVCIDELFH